MGEDDEKYGLKPIAYDHLVSWGFGDFIFHSAFDNISSTIKARRHGFHDCIDTEDMFTQFFDDLRKKRITRPELESGKVGAVLRSDALTHGYRSSQVSLWEAAQPARSRLLPTVR